jgi:transposase
MHSRFYDTDLTNAAWTRVAPVLPAARPGGRPRSTNLRAVLNAIFYLLRTGCQWRLLPREFPPCGTVYHYFQAWQDSGVWVHLHRVLYEQARRHAGRAPCPSVVIMDGQSVKTTERAGAPGFDTYKAFRYVKAYTNELVDNVLVSRDGFCDAATVVYANGHDLKDPLISPVYGDMHGFPPAILTTGTRDLLLSNTVRVHRALRAAGVEAQLEVYEGQSHAQYLFDDRVPETAVAFGEIAEFFDKHLGK